MNNLLKLPEVMTRTSLSRSQIYALAQRGEFPKPVKLSERSSAWVDSEVVEWIDQKIAERTAIQDHSVATHNHLNVF